MDGVCVGAQACASIFAAHEKSFVVECIPRLEEPRGESANIEEKNVCDSVTITTQASFCGMENMATVLFVRHDCNRAEIPSCGGAASAQHSAAHAKTDPFFSMAQLDQFLGAETWLAQVVVGDEE